MLVDGIRHIRLAISPPASGREECPAAVRPAVIKNVNLAKGCFLQRYLQETEMAIKHAAVIIRVVNIFLVWFFPGAEKLMSLTEILGYKLRESANVSAHSIGLRHPLGRLRPGLNVCARASASW